MNNKFSSAKMSTATTLFPFDSCWVTGKCKTLNNELHIFRRYSFIFVHFRAAATMWHACMLSCIVYMCVRMDGEKFKLTRRAKERMDFETIEENISQYIQWLNFLSLWNVNNISNVNENCLKEIISWNDLSQFYVSSIVLFIHCAWAAPLYGKYVNWKVGSYSSIAVAYIVAFSLLNIANQWA